MTDLLKKSLQESDLNIDVDYVVDNNIPVDVEDRSKISRGARTWLDYTNERNEKPIGPLAVRLYEKLGPGKEFDPNRHSIFNLNTPYIDRLNTDNIANPFDMFLLNGKRDIEKGPIELTTMEEKTQWLLEYMAGVDIALDKGLMNGINLLDLDNATQMDLYSAYQFYSADAGIIPSFKYPDGKLAWDGIGRVTKNLFFDKANWFAIGAFKPAFKAVEETTNFLTKQILGKSIKDNAWKTLMNTSVVGMIEGGTWMLGDDYHRQLLEIHGAGTNPNYFIEQWEKGLDVTELKKYDPMRGLFNVGVGGLFGLTLTAVPGSVINGMASYINRLKLSKNAEGETVIDFNDLESPNIMDESEIIEATMLNQGDDSLIYFNDELGLVKSSDVKKLYHGSPFTFDEFDMDKIGSGEGFQAYGYGIYKTQTEDIAKQYRDSLSGIVTITDDYVDEIVITPRGSQGSTHTDIITDIYTETELMTAKISILDTLAEGRNVYPDLSEVDLIKKVALMVRDQTHFGSDKYKVSDKLSNVNSIEDFFKIIEEDFFDTPGSFLPPDWKEKDLSEFANLVSVYQQDKRKVLYTKRDKVNDALNDARDVASVVIRGFHRFYNQGTKVTEEEFKQNFPKYIEWKRNDLNGQLDRKKKIHNRLIENYDEFLADAINVGYEALINNKALVGDDIPVREHFSKFVFKIIRQNNLNKDAVNMDGKPIDGKSIYDIYRQLEGSKIEHDGEDKAFILFMKMFPETLGDSRSLDVDNSTNLHKIIRDTLNSMGFDQYGNRTIPLDFLPNRDNYFNPDLGPGNIDLSLVVDTVVERILDGQNPILANSKKATLDDVPNKSRDVISANEDKLISFTDNYNKQMSQLENAERVFNDGKVTFNSEGSLTESLNYLPDQKVIDYDEPIAIDIPGPNQEIAIKLKTMLENQGFNEKQISRLLTEEGGLLDVDYEFSNSVERLLKGLEDLYVNRLDASGQSNAGAEALRQAMVETGIFGIKYNDGFSRGNKIEKTKNYVIMDPNIIKISKQYAIPIPLASAVLYQYMKENNLLDDM